MEILQIEAKNKTPLVNFNPNTGLMEIKGMSSAENAIEFYKPILDWIDHYKIIPSKNTTLNIFFKYFNTSSAKCILDVLERFTNIQRNGNELVINWHFEKNDEEMYDAGENFSEILETSFNLIEV